MVPTMTPTPGPLTPPAAATSGAKTKTAAGVVTPPMTPEAVAAWGRMRRGVDAARSVTGRVATVAGGAVALAALASPGLVPGALAATAVVTAAGAGTLRLQMPHAGHQKATATVLYVVPGAALGALMLAERLIPVSSWGGGVLQVAAVAVWAAGTWLLRPARVARRMACPPPPPASATEDGLAAPAEPGGAHPAARWWAAHVAAPGRPATGTVLEDITRTGQAAMAATIRATIPGEPVPDISVRRLSALLDVPEDQISIGPVPGRGAGVRRLTIGTPDPAEAAAGTDAATVWAERIAPLAMPGAVLTGIRIGRPATADTAADAPADTEIDTSKEDA